MTGRRGYLAALALCLVGTPVFALDAVTITVVGVADEERREALVQRLSAASSTKLAQTEEIDTAQDLFGTALADYARMVGVMFAEGFYGSTVSIRIDGREAADIDPFSLPQTVDAIAITVTPGPQFHFGETGLGPRAPGAAPGPIIRNYRPNDQARADLIAEAANAGVAEWRRAGHPLAEIEDQTVIANHRTQRLDVDLRLAPGPQLRFGPLSQTGDTGVSQRRVREIMGYPEGEMFSPEALRTAVNRVRRTGVWRTVSVRAAETPNPDGTLDYQLTLIEELPRRIGFNVEYSTLDGFTLGGFWLHRNLFGGAERLRIDGQASNIGLGDDGFDGGTGFDYEAAIRLTRPGTFGPDNDVFLFGEATRDDEPDFVENAVRFGVGLTRYFNDDLFGEVAGGLRYSDVRDAFGEREFYHAIFPSRLEWDRRDDRGDPRAGFYANLDATPFIGLGGESQSGATGRVDLRSYLGFGRDKNFVMAGRVQVGSVVGSDLDATPQDFLFYSGGGGTVRGFAFESLGITLPTGQVTGGRSFLGLSGELRQKITRAIGLVAFADAGYVGADSVIDEDAAHHSGVGLGVRYATPIGPVRVDVATPYSGEDQFARYELYIGVGQAF